MRAGWIVPGLVIMLIMTLLLYIPLPYSQSHALDDTHPLVLYCPEVLPSSVPSSTYCLNSMAPIVLTWTGGNASTWVEIIPCRTFQCSEVNNTVTPVPKEENPWYTVGRGASGSLSIWIDTNLSIMLVTNTTLSLSTTVVWNVMPEFDEVWGLFALLGMIIAVVGILLPQRPRSSRSRHDEADDHALFWDYTQTGEEQYQEGSSIYDAPSEPPPGDIPNQ